MTNREKYAKEILDIACSGGNIALVEGEIVSCFSIEECKNCAFSTTKTGLATCGAGVKQWAEQEYKEFAPCPFCGKTDTLIVISCMDLQECKNYRECADESAYVAVVCSANLGGCGASGGFAETREEAIEAWNCRVDNG